MSRPARSPYLVGPVFDWALFLLPPALSLLVGVLISHTSFTEDVLEVGGEAVTWSGLAIGAVIHAHLVAVFFRSHGNRDIYRLYRVRFAVVPLVLWGLIVPPWSPRSGTCGTPGRRRSGSGASMTATPA